MRNIIYSFFDDPRIAGVSKEYVKAEQSVHEDFILGT
jgi:hypothetical protein